MRLSVTTAAPSRLSGLVTWRYKQGEKTRDERIDFLRGLAILNVLIYHVTLPSLYQIISVETVGAVTGAEIFVLLSGVVLGLVNHQRMEREGWMSASRKLLRRALQIYLVALAANLIVYLLKWIPFLDASVLTSFTDPASGVVYSLYGVDPSLRTLIKNLLLLNYGAGQINILGLFVALTVVTPALLWLLEKKLHWMVIAASWAMYIYYSIYHTTILPFQSRNAFPFLAWQLLYVHGLLAGYYRHEIKCFLMDRKGHIFMGLACFLFAVCCFFALNNPWEKIPLNARFNVIPEPAYFWIYSHFFRRFPLGIGRVVDTFLVAGVLYLVLTCCWTPLQRIGSGFFVPLGQATLYIFIVHLLFVLILSNIAVLHQNDLVLNTFALTLVIFLIWLMVRKRVLFRLIPQ